MVDPLDTEEIKGLPDVVRRALLPGVRDIRPIDGGLELTTDHGAAVLPNVVRQAGQCGVDLSGVEVLAPDLEGVFLALTGKELRD